MYENELFKIPVNYYLTNTMFEKEQEIKKGGGERKGRIRKKYEKKIINNYRNKK